MSDAHAALHGGVDLLERAITYALGSLAAVRPSDLPRPTPCPDWDLRDLLAHLDDALLALAEAAEEGRVRPPGPHTLTGGRPGGGPGGDPVARLRARARRALGGWIRAAGNPTVLVGARPLTAALLTSSGAVEVAVHGWDVARSCGLHRPIPPSLAEELLDLAPLFVTDADRPGRFAPAVPVPPLAAPGDRLVAFLGRCPTAGARPAVRPP
jgi:uncharacterized protein (TIGR03086 family)